ncbi:MAG: DMT family transporter [Desulfovibrionaceae bacterium]|nr:DMT family transporter [Desulfovibrionaceae bacterium]
MSGLGLGIVFALSTAFSWALAGIIHTSISRRVGIWVLMLMRQPLATAVLGACCLLLGQALPHSPRLVWLAAASGLGGIIVCDACFYAGALSIGLRPTQVCQSLSASFTALLGALFLGERIGFQGWTGMAVATCGVILVVLSEQRDAHNPPLDKRRRARGLAFALVSALALAVGMIFSKQALESGMDALSLAFYRNAISTGVLWLFALTRGPLGAALGAVRARPGIFRLFLLGCLFGPAGGIWLSCMALEALPAAIASMLIELEPIALLILLALVERRMPARSSVLGACIACAGAAILLSR